MFHRVRAGTTGAFGMAIALIAGGVATADPMISDKVTGDDYRMTLTIEDLNIQSVPNMAAAPLVREGFVSATAKLKVSCPKETCKFGDNAKSSLTLVTQVGCPTQLDEGIILAPQAQLQAGLPDTLGGLLPVGGDVTTIGIVPNATVGPGALKVTLKPGYISDLRMGYKSYPPKKDPPADRESASIESKVSVTNRHIVVDQGLPNGVRETKPCVGPVTIRVRAQGTFKKGSAIDTVETFSGIYVL